MPPARHQLSGAPADRLDKILTVIGDDGRAVLADVLESLYPELGRDAALTAFRQFRREVSLAAKEAGVRLAIETDGQTRRGPGDRAVWFEGEDRVLEEVKRLVGAEVAGVERSPQDVLEDRPIRFFVSYAHADAGLKRTAVGEVADLSAHASDGSIRTMDG